jgi:dipeptidyl aminopeptidase/acylaminoacyl peptidase
VTLRRILLLLLVACGSTRTTTLQPGAGSSTPDDAAPQVDAGVAAAVYASTLAKDRAEHPTQIKVKFHTQGKPPPVPPPAAKLERVKYRGPLGEMWAYVSADPKDGKKHPAVVWAEGGFDPSIGDELFTSGPADNDQSAMQLRDAGIVVIYPSYRGAHDNPGTYELLYGEIDDYLAAADYVRQLDYVDPARVFFAGHSVGATIVLLAAELTDRFRAAVGFGPTTGAKSYGNRVAPFDLKGPDAVREWRLREPLRYLRDIRRPVLLIEGEHSPNVRALPVYEREAAEVHAPVTTRSAAGLAHFSVLAPELAIIAKKIAADDGQGEFTW